MGMSFLDEFLSQKYALHALGREGDGEIVVFFGDHDLL